MTPAEVQNGYVSLVNDIARLAARAGELEAGMSDNKLYPMSLQPYNHLRDAHRTALTCLHTVSRRTGVEIEVIPYAE